MRIGIIGAGYIGRALARLGVQSGCDVMISNSRGPETLGSAKSAIGCKIGTLEEAAAFGDVVAIAIPFGRFRSLPVAPFVGKIILDANNYYPDRDGVMPELENRETTTSELMAQHLKGARVVKAFNAILEKHLDTDGRPAGSPDRRALPLAGDDLEAKRVVAEVYDRFGFDAVDAGALSEGWRFERARPAYCVRLDVDQLKAALADEGPNVPEGSWRQ